MPIRYNFRPDHARVRNRCVLLFNDICINDICIDDICNQLHLLLNTNMLITAMPITTQSVISATELSFMSFSVQFRSVSALSNYLKTHNTLPPHHLTV